MEDNKKQYREQLISMDRKELGISDKEDLNTTKLSSEVTKIKDDNVEIIAIHGIRNIGNFIQSLCRIRNKKVNVYYKRISKKALLAKLRYLENQLFYYDEFIRLGEIGFIEEYGLDVINKQKKIFYLGKVMDPISHQEYIKLKVHKTVLDSLMYQYDMYKFMYENGLEAFFDKYFPNVQYYDLDQINRKKSIQLDIINNYIGKKIFKEEKKELVKFICDKYGLRAKDGSTRIGMKTINSFFEENNIPYVIESKRDNVRSSDTYGKRYWILKNI